MVIDGDRVWEWTYKTGTHGGHANRADICRWAAHNPLASPLSSCRAVGLPQSQADRTRGFWLCARVGAKAVSGRVSNESSAAAATLQHVFEPLPLNETTLDTLLAEGGEHAELDYKRRCNLNDRHELVEIVKDFGAFQIAGGYIVIGVDDHGNPVNDMTQAEADLCDEARIRPKVERYLAGFDIRSKESDLLTADRGLVRVSPHPGGWAVFLQDGRYDNGTGGQSLAFKQGAVYARHGSSSERWDQTDVMRIRSDIRGQEREAAKRELRDEFADLVRQGNTAQAAAGGPIGTLSMDLDRSTLIGAALEMARRDDDIPLTLLFKRGPATALELAIAGDDEFDAVLDRLTCLGAVFSTVDRPVFLRQAIDALGAIYNSTFDHQGLDRRDLGLDPADLRFRIVTRAFVLGALLVRQAQWSEVRYLCAVPVRSHDEHYWQNWLFHGDVMAARAGFHDEPNAERGTQSYKSTLVFAQEHIVRLSELRPDVSSDDEAVVTSLCGFSLLSCFVALSTPGGKRTGPFLAHFGRWFAQRTDPLVVLLIEGGDIRSQIYPEDDQSLADAMRAVGDNARGMSHLIHGWHGYEDSRVNEFLAEHPPPA